MSCTVCTFRGILGDLINSYRVNMAKTQGAGE